MILLDTHSTAWMTTDKSKLSSVAAEAIRAESRAGEGIAIASSTLWEVAMMTAKGKFLLPGPLGDYLRYLESVFIVLPITGAIAEQSVRFSEKFFSDPTDRIIAATAVVHGIRLVTKDKLIRRSKEVDCIW